MSAIQPPVAALEKLRPTFFDRTVKRKSGCWEWTGHLSHKGYGMVTITSGKAKYSSLRAHRVSWLLAKGKIPKDLHVLHKCDNRKCVNTKHLFLGTNADNIADKTAKSKIRFGSNHPNAVLTPPLVRQLMKLRQKGLTAYAAEKATGINYGTIRSIFKGETWTWLTGIKPHKPAKRGKALDAETVGIMEFRRDTGEYAFRVRTKGESFIVTYHGEPYFKVVPAKGSKQ